jgi:hypothetical protein
LQARWLRFKAGKMPALRRYLRPLLRRFSRRAAISRLIHSATGEATKTVE